MQRDNEVKTEKINELYQTVAKLSAEIACLKEKVSMLEISRTDSHTPNVTSDSTHTKVLHRQLETQADSSDPVSSQTAAAEPNNQVNVQ